MPTIWESRRAFVRALSEYLAGDQAKHSIGLELNDPNSKRWAKIRGTTPLFGYPTVEEAEVKLCEFLNIEPHKAP